MYTKEFINSMPPHVQAVLRELNTEEHSFKGPSKLGKKVQLNEKTIGCYSTVGTVSDNYSNVTDEAKDHTIFSRPLASSREPVRYQIAKQDD